MQEGRGVNAAGSFATLEKPPARPWRWRIRRSCAGKRFRCDGNPRLAPGCRKSSWRRLLQEVWRCTMDREPRARCIAVATGCRCHRSMRRMMDRQCERSRRRRCCRPRNRDRAGRRPRTGYRNAARCVPFRQSSSAPARSARYPWQRDPGGWFRPSWEPVRRRARPPPSNRYGAEAMDHWNRQAGHIHRQSENEPGRRSVSQMPHFGCQPWLAPARSPRLFGQRIHIPRRRSRRAGSR